MKIPIIMCIDVEPDDREIDVFEPRDWKGFEQAYCFFSELRPRLERATAAAVRFSWFLRMDPQIEYVYGSPSWVVARYPGIFKEIESTGDELGLHTHAWRWDGLLRRWVADHGNQEWINHCVRTSFKAFQKALGRPCQSFRFGDHWMNSKTMGLIEELGARFDLTMEPGRKATPALNSRELSTGSLPDYKSVPRRPYQPSRANFKEPGSRHKRQLQVIPLSTARRGRPKIKRPLSLKQVAKYFLNGVREPVPLNPAMSTGEFCPMIDSILYIRSEPYVALAARADDCGKQRYNIEQNFEQILSHPLADRFVFVTPVTAISFLS